MPILVDHASKHGATKQIAGHIAERVAAARHQAEAQSVRPAGDEAGYDAFVIGSAAYAFHCRQEAAELLRRNRDVLAGLSGLLCEMPLASRGRHAALGYRPLPTRAPRPLARLIAAWAEIAALMSVQSLFREDEG